MAKRYLTVLLLLALPLAVPGDSNRARSEILAAYDKAALAVRLKYVDGLLSIRNAGFKAYDSEGEKVDLSSEPARYELIFEGALFVTATTDVEEFRELGPNRAECVVRQQLAITRQDYKKKQPVTTVLDSKSRDEWVRTRLGWRQQASRILHQFYRPREEPGS